MIFVASRKEVKDWIRLAQCFPALLGNLAVVIEVLLMTCCYLSVMEW